MSQVHISAAETLIRARHTTRAFLPDEVAPETLKAIFELAATAPSNCNTQPWLVEVVSGAARDKLKLALTAAAANQEFTPDFPFDENVYEGRCGERRRSHGAMYYGALGIARDDREGRDKAIARNLSFFDAPHVALLFMPDFGGVRVAADLGMYAQNLVLAMAAHGLGSCCQTILGFYADTIRRSLDISEKNKLLFGISFGYADAGAEWNNIRMPRADVEETTRFHVVSG